MKTNLFKIKSFFCFFFKQFFFLHFKYQNLEFQFQKTFQMNKTSDSDLAPHFYASGHDKV